MAYKAPLASWDLPPLLCSHCSSPSSGYSDPVVSLYSSNRLGLCTCYSLSLSGTLLLSHYLLPSHYEYLSLTISFSIRASMMHPVTYAIDIGLFPLYSTKIEPSLHTRILSALNTTVLSIWHLAGHTLTPQEVLLKNEPIDTLFTCPISIYPSISVCLEKSYRLQHQKDLYVNPYPNLY